MVELTPSGCCCAFPYPLRSRACVQATARACARKTTTATASAIVLISGTAPEPLWCWAARRACGASVSAPYNVHYTQHIIDVYIQVLHNYCIYNHHMHLLCGAGTDAAIVQMRAFPGACAVAERLWSPMEVTNVTTASPRLARQRCRMLERGVDVTPLQPGFCI
eukprot:COSAG03_NODE_107_length_12621_cov_360.337087_14_plen_164_part_00